MSLSSDDYGGSGMETLMIRLMRCGRWVLVIAMVLWNSSVFAEPGSRPEGNNLRKAVSFYASFDESLRGDFGNGGLSLSTRFDSATEKGAFDFEPGFDPHSFGLPSNAVSKVVRWK